MTAFEFYCNGSGAAFYYVFNAVATIFHDANLFKGIMGNMLFCMLTASSAVFMYVLSTDLNIIHWVKRVFIMMFLFNALFIPKTTILIKDQITSDEYAVANVPLMLAMPVSAASQIGKTMASTFDAVFRGPALTKVSSASFPRLSIPDGLSYTKSGVGMASKLANRARAFRIPDPDMAVNMKEFVMSCMLADALPRGHYSIKELTHSENIWKLVKDHATPWKGFPWRDPVKGGGTRTVRCDEGAELLEQVWPEMIKHAEEIEGARFFPENKSEAQAFGKHLGISFKYLTGLTSSASTIFQQNMMKNAIHDGMKFAMAQTDSSAGLMNYAATRAQKTQENSWLTMGKIGGYTLSCLNIVIEIMVYSIFPIIAIITVLPGGIVFLKRYLLILVWMQTWPLMYAVLNMIINIFALKASLAVALIKSPGAAATASLSLATMGNLGDANATVAAVASGIVPLIPWLSLGLFTKGASTLSHLSQTMMHQQLTAAGTAGDEITMGRISFDQASASQYNLSNTSAFQQNTSPMIRDKGFSIQDDSGGMTAYHPDGIVHDRSGAISNIGGDVRLSNSLGASFRKSAAESHKTALNEHRGMSENLSSAFKQIDDFRHHRGDGASIDDSGSHTDSWMNDSSMMKTHDLIDQFAEEQNVSRGTAANVLLHGGAGASLKGGIPINPIVSAGGEISGGIKIEKGRNVNIADLYKAGQTFTNKTGFNDTLKSAQQEARTISTKLSGIDQNNYGQSIATHFDRAFSHQKAMQASLNQESSYNKSVEKLESSNLSIDQTMNQDFVNLLHKKYNEYTVKDILADPVRKEEEAKEFIEDYKDTYLEKFTENSSIPTSKEDIQNSYNSNTQRVDQETKRASDTADGWKQAVANKAAENNLDNKLDRDQIRDYQKNVSDRAQDTRNLIDQKKQEHQDNAAQKYKENEETRENLYNNPSINSLWRTVPFRGKEEAQTLTSFKKDNSKKKK